MNRQDLEAEIRSTLTTLTDSDATRVPIDGDLSLEIGLDSLGRLELLSEVEDRLGVIIYDVDTAQIMTIGSMIELCETAIAQNMEQA